MTIEHTRRGFLGLLAGGPTILRARELAGIDFSFIQVSDTHVSKRRLYSERRGYDVPAEESIRRTREAVKAINECSLPHELIIHTGDVAHTRDTMDDYDLARELHQFSKPAYYVPGNHDVGYSTTHHYRPEFEKRFGKSNRFFEPVDGLRIALFDSQPLDVRAPDSHREEAFERLDRILTPAKPTILCCHVMGLDSYHLNRVFPGWPDTLMKRWVARMKAGGVVAVLAGHFHRDEHHLVEGLPFHLVGPVVNFWGRQTCFRHWRLTGGVLTYRNVYLEI